MDAKRIFQTALSTITCTATIIASSTIMPITTLGSACSTAYAAQVPTGHWIRSKESHSSDLGKIALKVDAALNAQNPRAKITVKTAKRAKEIRVTVRARGTSAGLEKAKSKARRAHSSLVVKASANNMYRDPYNGKTVKTDTAIYGIDNYGSQTLKSKSARVGKAGTADIRIRYQAAIWTYKNNVFDKAHQIKEVYWNQSKSFKVASVRVPKGYRIVLELERR